MNHTYEWPPRPTMKVAEVADALAVSTDTVHRWAKDGQLPTVSIPRTPGGRPCLRFPTAAIKEMVEGEPAA